MAMCEERESEAREDVHWGALACGRTQCGYLVVLKSFGVLARSEPHPLPPTPRVSKPGLGVKAAMYL